VPPPLAAAPGSKPVFRLAAHDKPACALSFCPAAPGLLATASTDKKAKLWDVSSGAPTLLASQDAGLGAIFTASFCGLDAPHLLAMAGAKGAVGVWDVRSSAPVAGKWPALMKDATPAPGGAVAPGGKPKAKAGKDKGGAAAKAGGKGRPPKPRR
jgi:periodic tryptophan protein 1